MGNDVRQNVRGLSRGTMPAIHETY